MSKILHILIEGQDPELRETSEPVKGITDTLKKYVENMKKTLLKEKGAGLAAPQVGILERVILVRFDNGFGGFKSPLCMINPEIISFSNEMICAEEGCLSIPDYFAEINRHKRIKVKYLDLDGNHQIDELENFNARVVQHEIDHLDGVLFIDRL